MTARCNNKKHPQFRYYGARGIKVCDEWSKYEDFKEWALKNGWKKGLSIDRIDNNSGYSPSNCRWTTHWVQMSNTSWNKFLEYKGERKHISEWARIKDLGFKTIQGRLNHGWTVEKALETRPLPRRQCGLLAHVTVNEFKINEEKTD